MQIEKTFPARYWINLGRRHDRRVETEYQLAFAGITAERFPAVDARFVKRNRGYESAGRYALALSQRLAIRKAMLAGAEAVLVLEDDVVFHPELVSRLAEIELPKDWGIFYLGCAHHKRPWPAGQGLVRTPYALDTHAFAVRAPYFRKVMAALSRRDGDPTFHARASDWYLADLHGEIPTYACFPNLAWQAVAESDLVQGTYSNYTSAGEQISSHGEVVGLQAERWGARRWIHTRDPVPSTPDPRMALLFLTRGDVNHPEIWREFVDGADGAVTVLAHPKDRQAAERGFLAGKAITERHDTAWGDISLVRAMLALLKAALEDETITHFAFVSESCIPVKPWAEIRRRLSLDPRSMMRMDDAAGMKPKHLERLSAVRDLPRRAMRAHSQWSLLNREAAELLAERDLTQHFSGIEAPDEHYFGSVLAVCGYPEGERVNPLAPTWVRWTEDETGIRPESQMLTTPSLAAELAAFPGYFARKFPAGSDIRKWALHNS